MKAVVYSKYGAANVLELKDVTKPVPRNNQVLIKILASTVSSGDWRMRSGNPFGIRLFNGLTRPRIKVLGSELAGVVESVGKDVAGFKSGDDVFASSGFYLGANAQYICMNEDAAIVLKPDSMNYQEAAAVPLGAATSLYFLRDKANIQKGHKIMINGASGALGTFAIQIAKYFGAEVTAVCSTVNLELVKSLGADFVIDYTKENIGKSEDYFDIIFDTVGKTNFGICKRSLKKSGVFITAACGPKELFQMFYTSVFGTKKLKTGVTSASKDDLLFLKKLIENKKLVSSIDRTYSLEDTASAHRYVEQGHKRGVVVIAHSHA
jgi:NADPH2:quinone reductase